MALLSRKLFAVYAGITGEYRPYISTNIKRGKIITIGEFIDDSDPVNQKFLEKRRSYREKIPKFVFKAIFKGKKQCTKCSDYKLENEFRLRTTKRGTHLVGKCLVCEKKHTEAVKEKKRITERKYKANNLHKRRELYWKNREQYIQKEKERRLLKKRICIICKRDHLHSESLIIEGRKTRSCNQCKEKFHEREIQLRKARDRKKRIIENSEKRLQKKTYLKSYQQSDSYKQRRKIKIAKRKVSDPLFKATIAIRGLVSNAFKRKNFTKTERTQEVIGCDIPTFRSHIEGKFSDGMTWENHGEWHIDHIVPLATANSIEDLLRLNHFTNLQPLWKIDNLRKGSKLI